MTDATEMGGGDVIALVDPSRWDHPNAPQLAYAYGHSDAVKALAAQPSAGALGEVWFTKAEVEVEYHDGNGETHEHPVEVDWSLVARWRPQPSRATPAQPDTGSHGYGWNEDMTRLPAALTLIFRDPVDKDGCEMVRFGLSTDAMNATAWSYLPGVAQPDTGDVAALLEAREVIVRWLNQSCDDDDVSELQELSRDLISRLAALSKPNAPGAPEDGGA